MRWSTDGEAKIGDCRVVSEFLFLPASLPLEGSDKIEVRWLEQAKIRQKYVDYYNGDGDHFPKWVNVCWVDKEKKE